jgi:hypothetical protein
VNTKATNSWVYVELRSSRVYEIEWSQHETINRFVDVVRLGLTQIQSVQIPNGFEFAFKNEMYLICHHLCLSQIIMNR